MTQSMGPPIWAGPGTSARWSNSRKCPQPRGGGFYGDGTVFSLDPATGAETVLYFFCQKGEFCLDGSSPWGGLIDVKGKLYGTTVYGGDTSCNGGCGTVFSLNRDTGKEKVL